MGYAYVELPDLPTNTPVVVFQHSTGSLRCVLLTHAEFSDFVNGRGVPAQWLSVRSPQEVITTPADGGWIVLVEGNADFEVQVRVLAPPVAPGSRAALDSLSRLSEGKFPNQPTVTETFHETPIPPPRPPGFVGPIGVEDRPFPSDLFSVVGAPQGTYGLGAAKPVEGYPGVTQWQIVTRDRTPVGVITYGVDGQPGRPVSPGITEVKISDQDPKFALFNSDGSPGETVSWGGWGDGSWADFLSGIGKIGEILYPVPEVYRNIQNWEDISTGEKFWTGVDILGMLPAAGIVGKVLLKGGRKAYRLLKPAEKIDDRVPLPSGQSPVAKPPVSHKTFDLTTPHARNLGEDPAIGGIFREGEAETGLRIEAELNESLRRAEKEKPYDWVSTRTGTTYDAVGNFDAKFFDSQWSNLQREIVNHLNKAEVVPVDVSKFTKVQRLKVREFVLSLNNPRIVIIGD